jgi:hypothetical protein
VIKSIENSFLWLLPMESECNKQVNEARENTEPVCVLPVLLHTPGFESGVLSCSRAASFLHLWIMR